MKKLLAIAVAAGLAAPMAVMADTTLYGRMKVSVGSEKNAAGDSITSVQAHSSRIGVKGSTAMDNGLSVTHKVEFGTAGVIDGAGDSLSSRDAWVGLKGNFGEVRVGRHSTPHALASDAFDITHLGGLPGVTQGPFRVPNAIAYLKGFGPVAFAGAYVPDEVDGVSNDTTSTLLSYKSNGIKANWGYQKTKGSKALNSLGLGYTFPAKHMVNFVYNKDSNTDLKTTVLNGRYNIGKAYVNGQIAKTKDVDGSHAVLEAGYHLGKKTRVFGSLADDGREDSKAGHARVGIDTWF